MTILFRPQWVNYVAGRYGHSHLVLMYDVLVWFSACPLREHLFVCPGGIYRYVPVTSWYAGGGVPSPVLVCLRRIFSRTMSLSAVIGGARCPLVEEIDACIRQDRQAKCTQTLTLIIFCWSRDTFLLCAKIKYLQTDIYVFRTRSVANCRQANGATAILSRLCRQVWVGTFGICRLHACAPIPMQTNTPGTSRCTDRYIRYMQTSAPLYSCIYIREVTQVPDVPVVAARNGRRWCIWTIIPV